MSGQWRLYVLCIHLYTCICKYLAIYSLYTYLSVYPYIFVSSYTYMLYIYIHTHLIYIYIHIIDVTTCINKNQYVCVCATQSKWLLHDGSAVHVRTAMYGHLMLFHEFLMVKPLNT